MILYLFSLFEIINATFTTMMIMIAVMTVIIISTKIIIKLCVNNIVKL